MSQDIATYLAVAAAERPSQPAVISPGGQLSYSELEEQSNRCARGLQRAGIQPGMRTILMVRPGIEFVILAFALIKSGAVLVLVDPGIGRLNLRKCLDESKAEAFIGIPLAQAARVALGWARRTVRIAVTVGRFPFVGISFKEVMRLGAESTASSPAPGANPGDPAAVVFTSGSTGPPKGVVYTHGMFAAQACLMRDHFEIHPGEVDLATFPLFALFDPVWKATTVFPTMDFTRPGRVDAENIIDPIRRYGVTHMFGSPALLNRVETYCRERNVRLKGLKRILSAGAPVPPRLIRFFSGLLDAPADIHTPYGATEALPVCSISGREVLEIGGPEQGKGVCVGRPLPGVQVAVIEISEDPVPQWRDDLVRDPGQIGELVVWGPNVSARYFENPEADRRAKIRGPGGEVRHRMGDVGYLDEGGRVWFCGRKSHRVITATGTLFSVPCEGIFNQHPEVYRTALVGVGPAPRQHAVLCVELENKKAWKGSPRLRHELLSLGAKHAHTRGIQTLLFHPSFPVDARHNSKIFREKLAVWAGEQLR